MSRGTSIFQVSFELQGTARLAVIITDRDDAQARFESWPFDALGLGSPTLHDIDRCEGNTVTLDDGTLQFQNDLYHFRKKQWLPESFSDTRPTAVRGPIFHLHLDGWHVCYVGAKSIEEFIEKILPQYVSWSPIIPSGILCSLERARRDFVRRYSKRYPIRPGLPPEHYRCTPLPRISYFTLACGDQRFPFAGSDRRVLDMFGIDPYAHNYLLFLGEQRYVEPFTTEAAFPRGDQPSQEEVKLRARVDKYVQQRFGPAGSEAQDFRSISLLKGATRATHVLRPMLLDKVYPRVRGPQSYRVPLVSWERRNDDLLYLLWQFGNPLALYPEFPVQDWYPWPRVNRVGGDFITRTGLVLWHRPQDDYFEIPNAPLICHYRPTHGTRYRRAYALPPPPAFLPDKSLPRHTIQLRCKACGVTNGFYDRRSKSWIANVVANDTRPVQHPETLVIAIDPKTLLCNRPACIEAQKKIRIYDEDSQNEKYERLFHEGSKVIRTNDGWFFTCDRDLDDWIVSQKQSKTDPNLNCTKRMQKDVVSRRSSTPGQSPTVDWEPHEYSGAGWESFALGKMPKKVRVCKFAPAFGSSNYQGLTNKIVQNPMDAYRGLRKDHYHEKALALAGLLREPTDENLSVMSGLTMDWSIEYNLARGTRDTTDGTYDLTRMEVEAAHVVWRTAEHFFGGSDRKVLAQREVFRRMQFNRLSPAKAGKILKLKPETVSDYFEEWRRQIIAMCNNNVFTAEKFVKLPVEIKQAVVINGGVWAILPGSWPAGLPEPRLDEIEMYPLADAQHAGLLAGLNGMSLEEARMEALRIRLSEVDALYAQKKKSTLAREQALKERTDFRAWQLLNAEIRHFGAPGELAEKFLEAREADPADATAMTDERPEDEAA